MTYTTLVLNGNSTNGVSTLGAIQKLIDTNIIDIDLVDTYVATSSGSLISILLAIGMKPLDILAYLCIEKSYFRINRLNFTNVINGGILNFDIIEEELNKIIISKLDYIPTLSDVKYFFGKDLHFVTYNLTDNIKEYVSYNNYPNLPITKAVRMSSSFPIIFKPFQYKNKYYIDGGIVDNFPLEKAKTLGGKCIGITSTVMKEYNPEESSIALCRRVLLIVAESSNYTHDDTVYKLKLESSFFNFSSTSKDLINLFDEGYDKINQELIKDANL